jgi:hypothetical protein
MDLNSEQKEIVELFVKQELLICKLYKVFSYRYPEHKTFWIKMASEEQLHASWMKRLAIRDTTDKFRFTQGELRLNSLTSSIESMEGLISGVKKDKSFSITQAVSLSLHIEKALWERKVFQCFEGDSDEVRKVMDKLDVEQKIHIKKIDLFASQLQKKSS